MCVNIFFRSSMKQDIQGLFNRDYQGARKQRVHTIGKRKPNPKEGQEYSLMCIYVAISKRRGWGGWGSLGSKIEK